ncbi:hypothetical protein TorRG33x02_220400 [Trema orientale]|uniref:Secreted protein n=1 Tax=Trema orientale TaxID=63057 RepID=A0A2P5E9G4_TREOI|nr:hypothetical protein TorRG33x02_220400 [Trema orientale]
MSKCCLLCIFSPRMLSLCAYADAQLRLLCVHCLHLCAHPMVSSAYFLSVRASLACAKAPSASFIGCAHAGICPHNMVSSIRVAPTNT